jgi:hypothetical protein
MMNTISEVPRMTESTSTAGNRRARALLESAKKTLGNEDGCVHPVALMFLAASILLVGRLVWNGVKDFNNRNSKKG